MNNIQRKRSIRIAVSILWLSCLNAASHAHTVRSRELCGEVAAIDMSKGGIDLKPSRSNEIRHFAINSSVTVLTDWRRASLSEVQKEARACVYYRSPLFGKPFVTKILILKDGKNSTGTRGGLLDHLLHK